MSLKNIVMQLTVEQLQKEIRQLVKPFVGYKRMKKPELMKVILENEELFQHLKDIDIQEYKKQNPKKPRGKLEKARVNKSKVLKEPSKGVIDDDTDDEGKPQKFKSKKAMKNPVYVKLKPDELDDFSYLGITNEEAEYLLGLRDEKGNIIKKEKKPPNDRNKIVKEYKEKNKVSLMEASKAVKEKGLYKPTNKPKEKKQNPNKLFMNVSRFVKNKILPILADYKKTLTEDKAQEDKQLKGKLIKLVSPRRKSVRKYIKDVLPNIFKELVDLGITEETDKEELARLKKEKKDKDEPKEEKKEEKEEDEPSKSVKPKKESKLESLKKIKSLNKINFRVFDDENPTRGEFVREDKELTFKGEIDQEKKRIKLDFFLNAPFGKEKGGLQKGEPTKEFCKYFKYLLDNNFIEDNYKIVLYADSSYGKDDNLNKLVKYYEGLSFKKFGQIAYGNQPMETIVKNFIDVCDNKILKQPKKEKKEKKEPKKPLTKEEMKKKINLLEGEKEAIEDRKEENKKERKKEKDEKIKKSLDKEFEKLFNREKDINNEISDLKDKILDIEENQEDEVDKDKLKEFEKKSKQFIKKPNDELLEYIDNNYDFAEELDEKLFDKLEEALDKYSDNKK